MAALDGADSFQWHLDVRIADVADFKAVTSQDLSQPPSDIQSDILFFGKRSDRTRVIPAVAHVDRDGAYGMFFQCGWKKQRTETFVPVKTGDVGGAVDKCHREIEHHPHAVYSTAAVITGNCPCEIV